MPDRLCRRKLRHTSTIPRSSPLVLIAILFSGLEGNSALRIQTRRVAFQCQANGPLPVAAPQKPVPCPPMTQTISLLLDGYTDLPAGKIANVATYLEMRERPLPRAQRSRNVSLTRLTGRDADRYLSLYRAIGDRWLWLSRVRDAAAVPLLLDNPNVGALILNRNGSDIGLLELDWRNIDEVEIVHFGLVETEVGSGLGRWLMNEAIDRAFARPISRLFVHTCTFDHPDALRFYLSSGFTPYKIAIEVVDDPRLNGLFPAQAAPHVPIIARSERASIKNRS
jgi:GNAT superfamily N-acetyltransferase